GLDAPVGEGRACPPGGGGHGLGSAHARRPRVDELLGSARARSRPQQVTFLSLRDLTRVYPGEGTKGVEGVSIDLPRGEVLALLGPSGSGKTTTLRLLAGFERPDRGTVTVDGSDVTGLAPALRRFGMVFQHYALFPHLSVGENVAFGLTDRAGAA